MINHVRTLLLNRSGALRPAPTFFGEEYVPESFVALTLPSELVTIRRALLGSDPDNAGMNYLLWQYMKILHSTEFEEYVTALDSRVTYLHAKTLLAEPFGPTVGENAEALQFVGAPNLGGTDGRLMESWGIDRAGSQYTIRNYRTNVAEPHTPTVVDQVTEFMPMTGHPDFKVRVFLSAATASLWDVEYLARPQVTLDPINRAAQLANIGATAYAYLFPKREPYSVFKALWERHAHFPYKLSGALLAAAYLTEEIRRAG